jgi:hypothetical protein
MANTVELSLRWYGQQLRLGLGVEEVVVVATTKTRQCTPPARMAMSFDGRRRR